MPRQFVYIILFLLSPLYAGAQNLYLKVTGSTPEETTVIDSVSYTKTHENAKSVSLEADNLLATLNKIGYLEANQVSHKKENDSVFYYQFSVGKRTKFIHIYIGVLSESEKTLLNLTADTLQTPIQEVPAFMQRNAALLEKQGYSLSNLQLIDYRTNSHKLIATLNIATEKKRTLDGLVIEGYTKFPEGIRRGILRKYKGKTFNRENLQRLHNDFNNIRFVNQPRYPEILFKEDTTKVYVYLEKAKPNSFDGFIGFSSDENTGNVKLNGYLDLLLINVLNTGERFNLYWKNNGEEQTTFNSELELPYIFKSPIGLKGNLNIFKQDSTFQNTITEINAGYYFSYNSKVYLGRRSIKSVDIQNLDNTTLTDYTSRFWTGSYQYTGYTFDDFLFPEKTKVLIKSGLGTRETKTQQTPQYFIQADASHNFYLNKRNIINIRSENYYLDSNTYIVNELYRFGGFKSIRGFTENSLQASLYTSILAEYRFVLAPNTYIYSITDYGYFQDMSENINNNLVGLGFGFGLFTNSGLFNLIYANGSTNRQSIRLSNSIVHLSFVSKF